MYSNMDNQAMMNNMYQQQYAQQLNRPQPGFNQAQTAQTYYQPPAAFTNNNAVNAQAVSAQFNLNAQTFVPTNPMYNTANAGPLQPQPAVAMTAAAVAATNSYMYNPNNMANEANILKEKLARRLAKDIEDFQSQLSNFANFNAMPLKDKLEEWHFNVWPISGVYIDYIINGVIQFPTEYPQKPPSIELSVPIPHPNVKTVSSKAWVHLDILSASKWKQSYSILDIFRELSRIFSYTQRSELGDSVSDDAIRTAHQKLKSFKCMWTGHTSQNPVPKQGQPIPHSKKQINQLHASQPLTIENQAYQWRYCRIKQVECSFGKVYYEARVVSSVLGPNNLTTIQIGWALPPDDDPALGEEFEYVVLGNRYYAHKIGGVIIHKRPFEISHNNELESGFGEQGDKIACSADFEAKQISFYINGGIVGYIKFPESFIDSEKPLVPVIGLSLASVELNFKNLQCPIGDLEQSYLTIQEYLQIDRSDWVWERGSLVDWNVLFTYGLPMDIDNQSAPLDAEKEYDASKFRQIVLEIFHCLGFESLSSCREVCIIWNEVINRAYFVPRSKLKCYYSDHSFDSDAATCIGAMLNIQCDAITKSKFDIELLSASRDCISFNVWDPNKLNIQIDSKHIEYTHFLPLIINEEHGKRINKLLLQQIAGITSGRGFRAERALFVMASLLNSVIKRLHKKLCSISDSLTLWCHLHHILLFLCSKFPGMQSAADARIRRLFVVQKEKLSSVPDLGILIVYLLISEPYTWHTIRRLYVEESLSRDCKKLFANGANAEIKNKLDEEGCSDEERLDIMYDASKDSRSLTRLLVAFTVMKQTQSNDTLSIQEQLKQYNLRHGSPATHCVSEIEDKADQIGKSTQWTQYFSGMVVVAPPTKVLSSLLRRCFIQGAQSGYYNIKSTSGSRGGGSLPGRDKGRGRGRRGGDNYYDPNFNPNKQISKYTGFSHVAQAITQFSQFPEWIQSGCAFKSLNALQKEVMGDLCLGNDSVIVSSAGSGKSTAIILSSFYRLYTRKAPAHVLFIAVDHIHVELLRYYASKLGRDVPDLNIIEQIRGSRYIGNRQLTEGRNIFICSPGKAINLCENGQNELTENLVSVSIFDCDTLLVDPLFGKLKNTFKWIPTNINVNFVSTSYCRFMEKNMAQLIDFESAQTKKHLLTNNYDNLCFWFVFCGDRSLRVPMLNELCKVNPYRQGIVFCSGPHQAKVVQDSLKSMCENQEMMQFKSCILESDSINDTNQIITQYNNGSIQYIIAHEYSPIHMLYKIHPNNLKIIINFEIRSSAAFLKRCNIAKYEDKKKKIHCISLIDNEQTKIYEHVEHNCNVQLEELPSNVAQVLCDADAEKDTTTPTTTD
eukprot:630770_1